MHSSARANPLTTQIPGRSLQRTYWPSGVPGTPDPTVMVTGEVDPGSRAEMTAVGVSIPQAAGSVPTCIQRSIVAKRRPPHHEETASLFARAVTGLMRFQSESTFFRESV